MLAIRTCRMENKNERPLYIQLKDIKYGHMTTHQHRHTHTAEIKLFCFLRNLFKSKPKLPWTVILLSTSPAFTTVTLPQSQSLLVANSNGWTGRLTSLRISHSKFWMQSSFLLRQRWAAMRFLLRRRTSWMYSSCSEVSLCILIIIWKSFLGRSVIWSTGKGSFTWNQEK